MSHCNKEASMALREVGFNEECICLIDLRGGLSPEAFSVGGMHKYNFNSFKTLASAPDHLQAADWLWKNHRIAISLSPWFAHVTGPDVKFFNIEKDGEDYRDKAIIYACGLIKKRKA